MALHRVVKVLFLQEHVGAENYLTAFGDECPLHKPVTVFESNVDGRFEDEVAIDQTVRDSLKEFVCK